MKHNFKALALAVSLLIMCGAAHADQKTMTVVSSPDMTLILEPYMSDGQMRQYTIPGAASYWTNDLPIYTGDKVKIDVFVATGTNTLQEIKVRLDNVQVADVTQAPWNTTLDATKIGTGYHMLEAWAQVTGAKPTSPQFVSKTLNFLITTPPAILSDAPTTTPIQEVKGQQQILQGNTVVNVPLGNDAPSDVVQVPTMPVMLQNTTLNPDAKVSIKLVDTSTQAVVDTMAGTPFKDPVVASVTTTPGTGVHKFVYKLVSGDRSIVTQEKAYAVDTTRIRLQPRTDTAPGLLPGTTYLWVWGIDDQGKYGPPSYAKLEVAAP